MRHLIFIALFILTGCTQTRIVYVYPDPATEEELDEAIDAMIEVCEVPRAG